MLQKRQPMQRMHQSQTLSKLAKNLRTPLTSTLSPRFFCALRAKVGTWLGELQSLLFFEIPTRRVSEIPRLRIRFETNSHCPTLLCIRLAVWQWLSRSIQRVLWGTFYVIRVAGSEMPASNQKDSTFSMAVAVSIQRRTTAKSKSVSKILKAGRALVG